MHTTAEFERVVAGLADRRDTGLVVMPDIFVGMGRNLDLIIALAARYGVPTIYSFPHTVAAGGLISYGVHIPDLFRRAAAYVDRILKGAMPADLPVQLPTRFQLAINLKTAKPLGIVVPLSLLARADEVIE